MTEKIRPALSADEWAAVRYDTAVTGMLTIDYDDSDSRPVHRWLDNAGVVAVANHMLPHADPRKITREKLAELRTLIAIVENDRGSVQTAATAFVDALESYLPPIEL